ncbi:Bacteriophage protein [Mycobacteroides abscessus subsp. bolletii]|nr:Bacteriophage protein [Mycobacteroides abscessus subsp. bolletii]
MPVIGFDSFTGLPEDWREGFPEGSFAHKPPAINNTRLVIGRYADTLLVHGNSFGAPTA